MEKILHKKKKAFTLVELLIVLAVIAILFIVYISKVGFASDKAKLVGVQTDFRSFYIATKTVQMECSTNDIDTKEKFETALNKNLDSQLQFTTGINNAVDPWGYHYQYTYDNSGDSISVMYIAETGGAQTIYYSADNFNKSLSSNLLDGKVVYGAQLKSDGLSDIPSDIKDKLSGDIKETEKVELESIAITTNPAKVGYIEGEDFDPAGMIVSAIYSDHSTSTITTYSLNSNTNLSSGQTTVQVEYQDKTADVPVTVTNKTLSKIEITAPPSKTSYIEGEAFDPAGMVVTATYDNGKSEAVTDYVVQDGTSLTASQTTVNVVYGDKDITTPITVTAKQLLSIAVTTPPTKTTYTAGENFDPAGMVVTATYSDSTTEVASGYTINNGTSLAAGQTTVTVVYNGKSTAVAITVSSAVPSNVTDYYTYTLDSSTGGYGIALTSGFKTALNQSTQSNYKDWVAGTPLPNPGSTYDGSSVTSMLSLFKDCSAVKTLDLSNFDTSKVRNMGNMFSGCSALKAVNISGFNTSDVTDMGSMFKECTYITALNVSNWNTSSVLNMAYMFSGCTLLSNIDVSGFNTERVRYVYNIFEGCAAVRSLNLSGWNLSNANSLGYMFAGCTGLTGEIDISSYKITNTNYPGVSYTFRKCTSLSTVYVNSGVKSCITRSENDNATNINYVIKGK